MLVHGSARMVVVLCLLDKGWEEASQHNNTKGAHPIRENLATILSYTPLGRYGYILPSRLGGTAPTGHLGAVGVALG